MGFLQTLIHDITGHGGQSQQQTHDMGPQHPALQQFQPMQVQPKLPPHQVQGQPPIQQQVSGPQLHQPQLQGIPMHGAGQQPNLGVSMLRVQGNPVNPGFVPLQNSGQARPGSNPYTTGLQPSVAHWQNMGAPQNYLNPQVQDNGYFYDN